MLIRVSSRPLRAPQHEPFDLAVQTFANARAGHIDLRAFTRAPSSAAAKAATKQKPNIEPARFVLRAHLLPLGHLREHVERAGGSSPRPRILAVPSCFKPTDEPFDGVIVLVRVASRGWPKTWRSNAQLSVAVAE